MNERELNKRLDAILEETGNRTCAAVRSVVAAQLESMSDVLDDEIKHAVQIAIDETVKDAIIEAVTDAQYDDDDESEGRYFEWAEIF